MLRGTPCQGKATDDFPKGNTKTVYVKEPLGGLHTSYLD